jgi:hypothetical protein
MPIRKAREGTTGRTKVIGKAIATAMEAVNPGIAPTTTPMLTPRIIRSRF